MVFIQHFVNLVNLDLASVTLQDFPDVTLVCSDGRLSVSIFTLGLLLPDLDDIFQSSCQISVLLLPEFSISELIMMVRSGTKGLAEVVVEKINGVVVEKVTEEKHISVQTIGDLGKTPLKIIPGKETKDIQKELNKEQKVEVNEECEEKQDYNVVEHNIRRDISCKPYIPDFDSDEFTQPLDNQNLLLPFKTIFSDPDAEFVELTKTTGQKGVQLIYQKRWKFQRNAVKGTFIYFYCTQKRNKCRARAIARQEGAELNYLLDRREVRNEHNHPSEELPILLERSRRALGEDLLKSATNTRIDRLKIYSDFLMTWPETLTHQEKEQFIQNFPNYEQIENTLWRQSKLPNLNCNQCSFTFTSEKSLRKHKIKHMETNIHNCDKCAKIFRHKHSLKQHQDFVHSPFYRTPFDI